MTAARPESARAHHPEMGKREIVAHGIVGIEPAQAFGNLGSHPPAGRTPGGQAQAAAGPDRVGVERHDGSVRITCADDGPGLDEQTARRAFDRGYRGPASQGSGLGLYDARDLMRAQGGDLVLDRSRPGARFVATLPAPVHPVARIPRQRSTTRRVEPVGHRVEALR